MSDNADLEMLHTVYLPPATVWTADSDMCILAYDHAKPPPALHLCAETGGALAVRLDVQQHGDEKDTWPNTLRVDLDNWKRCKAKLGQTLTEKDNFPIITMKKQKLNSKAVTYELQLHMPREDKYQGLLFSITFGTDFLMPYPGLSPELLKNNPLCVDWDHIERYANSPRLKSKVAKFEQEMRVLLNERLALATKLKQGLNRSFLIEALLPQCFDETKELILRQSISQLRDILRDELVPILLALGIMKVATEQSMMGMHRSRSKSPLLTVDPWIKSVDELRSSLMKLEREFMYEVDMKAQSLLEHIIERVSLFVSLAYMVPYMEGAQELCHMASTTCSEKLGEDTRMKMEAGIMPNKLKDMNELEEMLRGSVSIYHNTT